MEKIENEVIQAYENVCKTSDELIKTQKIRIEQLEDEVKFHKEAVEKLFNLLDRSIDVAKNEISKNENLLTPRLN
jgi:predicted RNase H-like nuclease (RuvC/YqgF family)